jgi:hypothetical protein
MKPAVWLLLLLTASTTSQLPAVSQDWELVRSVPNEVGGTIDLVLVPEAMKRDRAYYVQAANLVCGTRVKCTVNFWTNRTHIPKSGWMSDSDLAAMTASYERFSIYREPVLHLACWLYPSKTVGESEKCEYPGDQKPPAK